MAGTLNTAAPATAIDIHCQIWVFSRSADARPMSAPLYEKDFYQWLEITADLVREGRFGEIDRDRLLCSTRPSSAGVKRPIFLERLRVLMISGLPEP